MLSEWRASLGSELELSVKVACEAISSMSHLSPNENGMADLKRWVKKFRETRTFARSFQE